MGNAIAFDTHIFVKKLQEAGFTEKQAEVLASTQAELIDERLATKRDMKELETGLKHDIKEMEVQLEAKIAETKADIIKWNVSSILAAVGLFTAIIKLLG